MSWSGTNKKIEILSASKYYEDVIYRYFYLFLFPSEGDNLSIQMFCQQSWIFNK